ncbi:MAG TPA: aminotransferase class I/II-fold pyridoxal phosphate-dependent enzyme [bacterium]|nr:aminotransferase class I/II-fold pyridoxal phosphate-dependent enzyme [bacterium]HQM85977.1 aminotransferase class I/II-fold pyridoxal phosphate-dependent enzyme [bacterium]
MRNDKIFKKIDSYDRAVIARKNGIYPYFREILSQQDTEVTLKNNSRVIMLGSNSYLGLQTHPEVKEAAIKAVEKYGTGCAGSPFLNGTLDIHKELEQELAYFVGKEDAMLFSTGFMANLGTISTLASRNDCIIMDRSNHASLVDAAKLSFGNVIKFRHNNYEDLETKLKMIDSAKGKLIAVDGVFSMEGDLADIPSIIRIAKKYNCSVMIDDAHGIGVMGNAGEGTVNHFGLTEEVDIIMGTFSKSLASIGGFVAADFRTIDFLRHHSRSLIFSASVTPASAATALASLKIIKNEPERIEKLWANTLYMKEKLHKAGLSTGGSATPIIPIFVGNDEKAFLICKNLERDGIFVNPVISPAVPEEQALIRVSLMATHSFPQIDYSVDIIKKNFENLGVCNDSSK